MGKTASVDKITAEHIKYCRPIITAMINKLFNLMAKYNYVPNGFGIAITIPIPKGEGNHVSSESDQYRGITISSPSFQKCLNTA